MSMKIETPSARLPLNEKSLLHQIESVDLDNNVEAYRAAGPLFAGDDFEKKQDLLVASPYLTRSHLLDLSTITTSERLFALALTHMEPTRSDFRTASYVDAFNWPVVLDRLRTLAAAEPNFTFQPRTFYLIAFRSHSRPSSDRRRLGLLDEQAHAEAMGFGGLLKYWFADPDAEYRNLATCAWTDRAHAIRANSGEQHRKAMLALREMYATSILERFELTVSENAESWHIAPI